MNWALWALGTMILSLTILTLSTPAGALILHVWPSRRGFLLDVILSRLVVPFLFLDPMHRWR